jgi:hypothetical protein
MIDFPSDPKHGQQVVEETGENRCICWTFYQPTTEWRAKEYGVGLVPLVYAKDVLVESDQTSQEEVNQLLASHEQTTACNLAAVEESMAAIEESVAAVEQSVVAIRRAMVESKIESLVDRVKEFLPDVVLQPETMPAPLPEVEVTEE